MQPNFRPSLGFRCSMSANGQPILALTILNLTFLMQVVLSGTKSNHVCICVLGDFHVSTDILMQNLFLVF